MFNAPRPTQAYGISSSAVSFGGSFVDENPLAASTYDGLDPWSVAPTPSPPPVPSIFTNAIGMCFSRFLYIPKMLSKESDLAQWGFMAGAAEATIPAIYHQSFGTVDPTNSGETSVNSLSRVLSTSLLPAATVDKVCLSPPARH